MCTLIGNRTQDNYFVSQNFRADSPTHYLTAVFGVKQNSITTSHNSEKKNYNNIYGSMWRMIDKTVRWNKTQRSFGFALSRYEASKIAG